MKQLNQNKQKLQYANYQVNIPIYAYDSDGNIITQDIDGETVEVIDSYKQGYADATEFKANISFNSGDTQMAEYGLNVTVITRLLAQIKGNYLLTKEHLFGLNQPLNTTQIS